MSAAAATTCIGLAPPAGASAVRHYERVSPAEKGQGDIVADGITTVASTSGDAVIFNSRTPFGDTIGSGVSGQTQFVARRGDDAWTTHAITPTPQPSAYQTFFVPTQVQIFSDDLRAAVVWAYDLPDVSDDEPVRNNIYVEDTATRSLQTVTASQQDRLFLTDFLNISNWGVSADARHVAFVTATKMLPEAAPDVPNVYNWDDGVLSLVGILPDGTVPISGSDVVPSTYREAMSADGTRQLFSAASPSGGATQLYMRVNGTRTAWVSQPEGSDQSDPVNVLLQAATPDGHNVFFVTDSPLLDEDTDPGPDIYRYTDSADPSRDGNLTLISHTGDASGDNNGGAVTGVSDDGERVYYQTSSGGFVLWDHGVTHAIGGGIDRSGEPTEQLTATASQPGLGRVTSDGAYAAFVSRASPDQIHGPLGDVTNGLFAVYLYSLRDDRLMCVSCSSGGVKTNARVTPATRRGDEMSVTGGDPQVLNMGGRPQFLSENGRVFFSTGDALVPEDVNGVFDAYEYDPATGRVSLLSRGTGSVPSAFADASASGDDVFIVTRQRLVAADRDNLVDMYDARIGSTLPEPQADTPPCSGDSCQPPPSTGPADDPLGSLFLEDRNLGGLRTTTFTVRQRIVLHGTGGALKVRVSVPGSVRWSGRGLRAGASRRGRAGTRELRLRLNRHARAQLRASGTYTTVVHLMFVSADGNHIGRTTRVTFRAVAKKGR